MPCSAARIEKCGMQILSFRITPRCMTKLYTICHPSKINTFIVHSRDVLCHQETAIKTSACRVLFLCVCVCVWTRQTLALPFCDIYIHYICMFTYRYSIHTIVWRWHVSCMSGFASCVFFLCSFSLSMWMHLIIWFFVLFCYLFVGCPFIAQYVYSTNQFFISLSGHFFFLWSLPPLIGCFAPVLRYYTFTCILHKCR